MDNEPVQQLLFSFGDEWNKDSGERRNKEKRENMRIFFFFFNHGGLVNADLSEVFHTLGIVRRHDSSGSLDRGSTFTKTQTYRYLCWRNEYHNLLTKWHTKAHKRAQFLLGEKWGLAEAIRQEVCFKYSVGPVCLYPQPDKKYPLSHFQIFFFSFFFMHNSVSEIWRDEEMVSSFPQH